MQKKRIHFRRPEVWTYRVGKSYVRITNPQLKSWAVRIADVLKAGQEAGCGVRGTWVPANCVKAYIQRYLRFYRKCIIPERGALVLLKRALLKL